MANLGWPPGYVLPIGVLEFALTLLYIYQSRPACWRQCCSWGSLAARWRRMCSAGRPLFSHQLFSIYLGLIMWGGLWLRDEKLRALFPFRRYWQEWPPGKDAYHPEMGSRWSRRPW